MQIHGNATGNFENDNFNISVGCWLGKAGLHWLFLMCYFVRRNDPQWYFNQNARLQTSMIWLLLPTDQLKTSPVSFAFLLKSILGKQTQTLLPNSWYCSFPFVSIWPTDARSCLRWTISWIRFTLSGPAWKKVESIINFGAEEAKRSEQLILGYELDT